MKIALSTQQIAPVYPSNPLHPENRQVFIPEKRESIEFKDVLHQAHQITQERALVERYQRATERALARSNGETNSNELEIYQYDGRRKLNIKHNHALHSLHISV